MVDGLWLLDWKKGWMEEVAAVDGEEDKKARGEDNKSSGGEVEITFVVVAGS